MAMNDHDVLTTVRDAFAPVQMTIPPDDIMTRGRSLRRRKHRGQLAVGGALALALGTGLGVSVLTAGSPAAQQATLAAWTVQRDPGGAITVTIRELRDLPALQARLDLDGAPVMISDSSLTLPHGCVAQATAPQMLQKIVSFSSGRTASGFAFTLRPSLIPSGQQLQILLIPGPRRLTPPVTAGDGKVTVHGGPVTSNATPGIFITLVKATPQCAS
jgi:hypothetical protein